MGEQIPRRVRMENDYLGEDFSWSKVMWMGIGMFFLMFIVGTVLQVLFGAQFSLVERLLWEQEVASSNPAAPTNYGEAEHG